MWRLRKCLTHPATVAVKIIIKAPKEPSLVELEAMFRSDLGCKGIIIIIMLLNLRWVDFNRVLPEG